jgi:hypothetical protein
VDLPHAGEEVVVIQDFGLLCEERPEGGQHSCTGGIIYLAGGMMKPKLIPAVILGRSGTDNLVTLLKLTDCGVFESFGGPGNADFRQHFEVGKQFRALFCDVGMHQ